MSPRTLDVLTQADDVSAEYLVVEEQFSYRCDDLVDVGEGSCDWKVAFGKPVNVDLQELPVI